MLGLGTSSSGEYLSGQVNCKEQRLPLPSVPCDFDDFYETDFALAISKTLSSCKFNPSNLKMGYLASNSAISPLLFFFDESS